MPVRCSRCGKEFAAQRPTAKYCSASCRAMASRDAKRAAEAAGLTEAANVVAIAGRRPNAATRKPKALGGAGVESSVLRELGDAASTSLGEQALVLARRLDANVDTGSALASLSKQLVVLTAAAVRDKAPVAAEDPVGAVQAQVLSLRASGAGA